MSLTQNDSDNIMPTYEFWADYGKVRVNMFDLLCVKHTGLLVSIYACHLCARAMLIFSVSPQS